MPEEPDDDAGAGLPPHQLDRVWFHPSELGGASVSRTEPPARRRDWGLAAAAAVCGVVMTLVVLGATGALDGDGTRDTASSPLAPTFAALAGGDHTAGLVASVGASVLAVRATSAAGTANGSGFALGGDRVLTNASLVAGADTVDVTTADGRVVGARVAGSDGASDLSVLIVADARVPAARLGTADALNVGSWVLAVGTAGGERRWASQGVVSGIGDLVAAPDGTMLPGLLGTDVDPTPTAAGGPLLDEKGSVVAVMSRVAPGHALPIDVARDVAEQLTATGQARHGWLGVAAGDAAERPGGGARLSAVTADGPAATAGLAPGDVVSDLGDDRITDVADLVAAVTRRRPGDPVALTIWRGSQRVRVTVTLGDRTPAGAITGP